MVGGTGSIAKFLPRAQVAAPEARQLSQTRIVRRLAALGGAQSGPAPKSGERASPAVLRLRMVSRRPAIWRSKSIVALGRAAPDAAMEMFSPALERNRDVFVMRRGDLVTAVWRANRAAESLLRETGQPVVRLDDLWCAAAYAGGRSGVRCHD